MTTLVEGTDPPSPDVDEPGIGVAIGRLARRALSDSLYALSAFPIALAAFVLSTVFLTLGFGLIIVVVGGPIVAAAMGVARWFGQLERVRLSALLGRPAPPPSYRWPNEADRFGRRALASLQDPQSWRDVSWTLLGALSATAASVLTLTWWAVAGGGLTYWFWQFFIPAQTDTLTLASAVGLGEGRVQENVLNFLIGALALATGPFVVCFASAMHATLATALLVGVPLDNPGDMAS